MVQGDAVTQIVLFQLYNRGPTPLLEGKNDEQPRFFSKMVLLRGPITPPLFELQSKNFIRWVFNLKLTIYEGLVKIRGMLLFDLFIWN